MSRVRVTPRARRDVDAIADYTLAKWGEKQAEKYIAELEQRFRWLGQCPAAGRVRDEVCEGYRSYPHGAHVIFYIVDGGEVAVIGVPHGAMDIDAYLDTPG